MPAFLARYPGTRPEWHFENRSVDLIGEGYDAAIGGGFALAPGVVSRPLAPAHIVAAPRWLAGRTPPAGPADLAAFAGIVMRVRGSGRVHPWTLRDAAGHEHVATLAEILVLDEPAAMREAALLGLGVALLAVADVLPWLERGELVRRLPGWYADAGAISLYYASRTLLPAKPRAFVDFVSGHFRRERFTGHSR
ncbi:LysR substrate binding domain-containing protein [Plasticicumulans lactativorans]|uniref:LysR substrate binding domain-containing protein n=1 Tax=Plasticicumulans lactativorans TaxID=1133106 RepID=A0A4R2L868_9GAMM|nr:LysR substrate binding domain-containing protein [Plasticicumulans lactativorans]